MAYRSIAIFIRVTEEENKMSLVVREYTVKKKDKKKKKQHSPLFLKSKILIYSII